MRTKLIFSILILSSIVQGCSFAPSGQHRLKVDNLSKFEYASLPHMSVADVAAIAEKVTAGRITELSLESSEGYLVYDVSMVATDRSEKKLKIDAGNGMVVSFEKIENQF